MLRLSTMGIFIQSICLFWNEFFSIIWVQQGIFDDASQKGRFHRIHHLERLILLQDRQNSKIKPNPSIKVPVSLFYSLEHIFILISLELKLGVHHVSLLHGGPPRSCRCKFGILFDGFAKPGFLRRKIAPPGEARTQDSSISLSSSYGRTRRERRKNWGLFNQKKITKC